MGKKHTSLWALGTTGAIVLAIAMGSFVNKNTSNKKVSLETKIESKEIIETPQMRLENLDLRYNYNLEELNKFDQWIDSTLNKSAKDSSNSIIINKSDYTLYLITNGKVESQYNIELGFNPIDDKQRQGDGCTPEGMYDVSWKREIGQTSFYRAFLINYPNEEDKAKGKTGSAIEIHGEGGKGYNWTLGCIALSNEDMDKIFPYLKEGDKITIVKYTSRDLKRFREKP